MKKPTHLLQPIMECYALLVKKLSCCTNSIAPAIPGLQSSKKRFLSYALAMVGILLFMTQSSYGQEFKDFTIRKKVETRGKMIVAGNTILGVNNLPFNDDTKANQDVSMRYIDIDADGTTFSSSSADLVVPNQANGSATTCYRVQYAALYWAATLKSGDGNRANINQVKLKLPGATSYTPITGQVIYDAIVSPIPAEKNEEPNTPYACYADVTSLINSLSTISGTYTVADVLASQGSNGTTGLSAGWTLYVVYEDPTLTMKSFNVFDGFSAIFDGKVQQMDVAGFSTPPSGPVDLEVAYALLDGDKTTNGTKLEIDGKEVTTPLRSNNKFFNATIENTNGVQTPRNPMGSNTLGYDTGVLEILGANPAYVKNNQSSTNFTMQVAKGQSDPVFAFFAAYAVDIIAPKIDLTKLVKNTSGVEIGGSNVNLGQFLTYEISYQSVGNDNVTQFTIKDVLPVNTIFNPATGIDLSNAGGATLQSYDAATGTLIFNIPDASVRINGGLYTIRLNVQVVPDCNSLATACSNEIKNQAFASYRGVINPTPVVEEGSFASVSCKLGSPESTNFLVGITNCTFTQNVILCGNSVVLKASDGYSSYVWSRSTNFSNPIGVGQTFTATQTGVYYVRNTAPATCKDIIEEITVSYFGVTNTNPVIPYAQSPYLGEVAVCPNDGKLLPKLFLCGLNDNRLIKTGIADAQSINWFKLDEATCPSTAPADCANENLGVSCWNSVGTGPDYLVNAAGQYKLVLNYTGGCQTVFYFNVFKNDLAPTFTKEDIVCAKPGKITVGNVPTGYEYSLDGVNYIPNSPIFTIPNPGMYTVYIKQIGVLQNPCIFTIPNIQIFKKDLNVRTFVTQPTCNGVADGSIKLIAENVEPQYYFSIYQGATLVNSVGPILANEHTFQNLAAGAYTVNVSTSPANCTYTATETIVNPPLLQVTANLTKPLTCTNGEVTISIQGGTPNFNYYVNGVDASLNNPSRSLLFPVSASGVYNIRVVDLNKCEATTSITVAAIPPPVFTVTEKDILCYGTNSGEISFNVTNANGYTLAYSIDNGLTYVANGTFFSLAPGTYTPILKYSLNGVDCLAPQPAINITEPAAAVTASMGVSELAGCGPLREGKVRITNPQGGVAPYEYSFDNQATWTTINETFKAPGTYTLYVRDFNKCVFSAQVIVDPEPAEPIVTATPIIDYNCDGSATSTVTVTNPPSASYTYTYYLDGNLNTNTPSNVFVGVPSGNHVIRVDYKLNTVPTFSTLLIENFGSGNPTKTSGIAAAYCFNDLRVNAPYLCGTRSVEDNQYSVTNDFWRSDDPSGTNVGAWFHFKDHTTNPNNLPGVGDPKGRYLLVNIGSAAGPNGVLYSKPIVDVIPNQPVKVDFAVANLLRAGRGGAAPDILIQLVNSAGTVVAQQYSGKIAESPTDPNRNKWVPISLTLNPGNNTNLTFVVRSGSILYSGNDVVIDDINVYQLPKTCISSKDFPIFIDSGEAFAAQIVGQKNVTCNGLTNGEITIAAQNFGTTGFEYSTNNGTTWTTSLTSPVTISTLGAALYKVIVRPVGTTIATCAKPFDVTISAPAALTLSASVTKLATCTTGATITAIGGGGTPAYQYELRQADGTTVVTAYSNNGGIFTNVPAGNYTVFVKDANGCEIPVGVAVNVTAPPALTAALATTTDYCYTTANPATLDVTVTGGTGPFTYKLNGNAAISSALTTFSFPNVAPGTHTIVVTDSNNCTATISSIVIAPQLGLSVSLLNDLTCLVDASIGNPVVSGGNGTPYTYTVSYNGGAATAVASFPFTAATAGTYVFTVTDSRGCPATSNTITVTPKTTPTITVNKTDITCNNANDGTITVTAAGGFTSAYNYILTGPVNVTQTTNIFTNLPAGNYTVSVTDSKGCPSLPFPVTIVDPTPIAANATATAFACTTTNTKQAATITVVPTGGVGGYTYSYNNGASYGSSNTLTVNDNGTLQQIRIIVRDANGCLSPMQQIDLAPLNPPTIATITNTPIYCLPVTSTTSTVTVPVTALTGVAPLTYEITSGPVTNTTGVTTGIFTGLTAGTYIFKVTDANGCFAIKSHTVPPVTPIAATATKLTDVACFGVPTGSIRYNVSGFSGNYSYTINGGAAVTGQTAPTFTLDNLGANTYDVVFTDTTTGCIANTSVIVSQPTAALALNLVSNKNANCNVATARVEILAAGGTPNYRYSFVTSATTPGTYGNSPIANLDPLVSTTWYAHVIDAKGCTFILPITIAADPIPTVTASGSGCLGTVGGYTITATNTTPLTGIVAPITYSLNGGAFQTGNTFAITASGDYTVRMKDGNGCIVTAAIITVVPQLTLTAVLNKDITCVVGDEPARITVTPTGGSGSFTYTASPNTGTFAGAVFTTSTAGTYTFTVTDTTTGCTYTTTTAIEVTTPVYPDITSLTQTAAINCNGDDTGAIKAIYNASLGQAPFQFSIDGTTFQNSDTFTGLSAGTYTVTIRDAKGCTDTFPITITEPDPIVIDFDTKDLECVSGGIAKGQIIINNVTGGTPVYNYYVTGINNYYQEKLGITGSAFFDIVDFGLYQIRVTDLNGCSTIISDVKIASPPNYLDISILSSATCATGGVAEVKIGSAFPSSGPFHFNIYKGGSPAQTWTTHGVDGWQGEIPAGSKGTTFTGLTPGVTYTFIVYDEITNCYYYQTADTPIPSTTNLSVNNFVPNNITCASANDGNVSFDILNGNAYTVDVNYQVYEDFTNLLITGVGGTTTIAAGGTFNVVNLGTLPVGSYYVLVQETSGANAGCSAISAPFNIKKSPVELTITATVIKNANCTDLGIIMGQAKEGTGPYTYQVTTSATPPSASDVNWVTGNTFTRAGSLAGTTYYVYAKDAYGCIKSDDVILLQDAPPAISVPTPICYNGTAFTINLVTDASATATIAPATYSVNGSAFQSSPSFTFNAAGTYNLVIKDGNGCTATVPYEVYPKLDLSAAVTTPLDCIGSPDAIITLTVAGGNPLPLPAYTYEVNYNGGGYVAAVNPYTATAAGTYDFRVTDANNTASCQTTTSIVLDPIPTTVFSTTETNVTCDGGSDGTITVNVTAGEGPYTFTLSGAGSNTTGDTNGVYTGLPAGVTYVITVINAKNCPLDSSPITITAPSAITAFAAVTTPLSCGTGNITQQATVTVTASGGTGVLEYSFDGGANYSTVNTYTTNTPGLVSVLVRDANGCPIATAVTANVLPLNPPTDMDFSGTPVYCAPAASTTSTVTVTVPATGNGIAPFTYQIISPIAAIIDNLNNPVFTGLTPDTYVFQVTDANGCTYQESYTVAPVTNITVAASATTNVTCFSAGDGTATFDIANFAGNYNYVFDSAPIVNGVNTAQLTFTTLAPGLHTLVVTDAITGCQATASVTITQPAAALALSATATNINCNNDNATITVTATGGTPAYRYAAVPATTAAPAAAAYSLSNLLTVDTNTGAIMTWDVYVMDANGCVTFQPVSVATDANPTISTAVATQCPSATGTYTITVTASGFSPALQYSADGTNYQTSNVITVNAPGNYTIYVKDANGCPSAGFPITILDPLILTPTVTTPVSCANGDGVISVSTTGGSGNYEYRIDGGAWTTATPFTNVSFGTRTIEVRDTVTTCIVADSVILQQATPITGFALAKTEVTCTGGSDGTITATLATPAPGINDNPVYTYTLSGTTTRPAQASPLFSGLSAGTYTVVVTSERGCTDTETITIIEPGLITVPAPTVVQFGCTAGNTGNLATITVTGVTGGTAPYLNYEFIKVGTPNTVVQFGSNNVYSEANLSGGSYIVNVYDSKGCIGTTTAAITINPYIQLDKVNVVVDQAITCTNLENITVTATTIGGPATNLQYTLVDVTYDNTTTPPTAIKGTVYPLVTNTNGVFTNLPIGNYEITVRNLDTNCEIIGVHYVNNPNTFDLTIDNVVDVTCFGGTNGSARVTLIDRVPSPVDNAGPFTYTLVDALGNTLPGGTATSAGPITLTNLAAGTYTITATLTNTPNCTVSKNFTIAGPTAVLDIQETHTAITCVAGYNDGSISATATGGWPGVYEFELLNGTTPIQAYGTNASWTGLTAGIYTVNVRDRAINGCVDSVVVTLVNPTPIVFATTTINQTLLCKNDRNASITVNTSTGGQGTNYLYTLNTTSATPMISSGPQASPIFSNLGAGTYTVTVTDGWGCGTTSAAIVIAEPTEVVASLVLASSATCLTQSTLTLSATGGTGAYEYSTTATGPWIPMAGNTATISVAPGTYRYFVRDANGCTSLVSNDIQIDPLLPLTVKLDVLNAKINCKGDTNGVIVATATGGLGNYIYTLLDGAGNPVGFTPVQTTPGNFTQLPAGTYSVRVNSGIDCQVVSVSEIIEEPLLPVTASSVATPVTCNGAGNGIITVTASGGTGVIKYAISPRLDQFFDTGVFRDLTPGNYDIIVQDENGCFVLLSDTITEPLPIFVNTVAGSEVQELCVGDNNAGFDINITGGVAPYSVSLDDINGTYVVGTASQTVFNFAGLTGGEHTVYIKDFNGCTAEWIVTLDEPVNLDPKAAVDYGCDNNAPSNTVTVTVDASITNPADVDYALDGSTVFQASNIFKNVAPGFHTITARHTNGCEKVTASFEVLGFTPLALTLADGGLNEIVATATGGAGNYQYSFNGGSTFSTNNKLIYYRSGDYTVIVRDANGCEATATRYFEFIDIEIPNVFTPNGDGNNETWTPINTINYKDLTISIFDRYGRKIATLREGQGWDGRYNNLELPTGDYWYILKLKNVQDAREFVGHFTLMR